MKDHLYILTSFDFKKATGAAWSRVNNYAECLRKTNTTVYLASSAYDLKKGASTIQTDDNIFQIQSSVSKRPLKSFIQQFRFIFYYKHYKYLYEFCSKLESEKKVYFLYSFNLSSVLMSLFVFGILKKQAIFCEKNELELGIILNQQLPKSIYHYLPAMVIVPMSAIAGLIEDWLTIYFKGIIVISTRLWKLYSKKNRKTIMIPILANKAFFNQVRNFNRNSDFRICYAGDINQNKDGILDFLKALKLITNKRLVCDFYGNINPEFRSQIDRNLKSLESFHTINIFTLRPHDEIAVILSNYDLLILPRPQNLQTSYGFSTKLAEYLASSVPVLASKVSDNDLYIIDGENGFLFEPGDISQLKTKILEIVNFENKKLIEIGVSGRKTALEFFTISRYSTILRLFFFNK